MFTGKDFVFLYVFLETTQKMYQKILKQLYINLEIYLIVLKGKI